MINNIPFVSIVVPTYNNPESTKLCLQSLVSQKYPKDKYEIIVVDNESNDGTLEIIRGYPVKLFIQSEMKSPYPSRNIGIKNAIGTVIALVDANCIPEKTWLENGVGSLNNGDADVVGGAVFFTFSKQKTCAEMYDALTNIKMKENIMDRKIAKTANLFAYRYVFDKIGLFPIVRSGGDVIWTKKASENGFKLQYADKAIVYKSARKLWPLIKKQFRVGKGQPNIWIEEGKSQVSILQNILSSFFKMCTLRSPSLGYLKKRVVETGNDIDMKKKFIMIFIAGWLCVFAMNLGRIQALIRLRLR